MFALQHWGINPSDVKILNMQPNQIVAAWERGDIDAAYVWDPALAELKKSGKVLITSGDLSKLGKPTFDGIAVDRKWGEDHKDFMAKLVKAIADADQQYRQQPRAMERDIAAGRGHREDDRRHARRRAGVALALRVSDARRAGVVAMARRRRDRAAPRSR